MYLILLVNRLWIFIFGVERQRQLIKEPRNHSLLESENALNVLWIKVNNAVADMPATHDSPMNNTVKMQNMNMILMYKVQHNLQVRLMVYFNCVGCVHIVMLYIDGAVSKSLMSIMKQSQLERH